MFAEPECVTYCVQKYFIHVPPACTYEKPFYLLKKKSIVLLAPLWIVRPEDIRHFNSSQLGNQVWESGLDISVSLELACAFGVLRFSVVTKTLTL